MNAVDSELETILREEADAVRPPDDAKARGWERLAAALAKDVGGPDDGGAPSGSPPSRHPPSAGPPPSPALKVVPLAKVPLVKAALAAVLVTGALLTWSMGGAPQVEADTLASTPDPAPATLFGAPMHIPFVQPPRVAPTSAPPASSPGEIEAPTPPRTTTKPRAAPDEDNFAGELSLLAAGQAAIQRGELREGLALLRTHKQRFPGGHFAQERDALIAIARCDDHQSGAREAGRKFLRANAESIHAERVRAACKLEE